MENHLQVLPGLEQPFCMVAVAGGAFEMGGASWSNSSLPVHPVEVDDFWMGQYPVTQALWAAVMGPEKNPSHFKGRERPVESVSWQEITDVFLPELNKLSAHARPPGMAYRLPTEAEWEYAARGGKQGQADHFPFAGGENLDVLGWYNQNSHNETKPVGLKWPNELGIYDLSGNVWECCEDHWHDNYNGAPEDGTAWLEADEEKGMFRVRRGGSRLDNAKNGHVAYRFYDTPWGRHSNLGFRLVLSAFPV